MERQKLPAYFSSKSLKFKGKRIDVYSPEFINSRGKTFSREIVIHPGAVVILPFINENEIILIKNYRVSIDEYLLELPAGTMEIGEAPYDTASRELIEETGYSCESLDEVQRFYTSPGFTNELMIGYVARGLTYHGQKLEENEEISVVKTSLQQALEWIEEGLIKDAKTILMLLYSQRL